MRVTVAGLWHLGTVTAACCAAGGHSVTAYDDDSKIVADLNTGCLPVAEPGLVDLTRAGREAGKLHFTDDRGEAGACDLLWICYDTPVDEQDVADVEFVRVRVRQLLRTLNKSADVLISSQMPVGSTPALEREFPALRFSYSPENLRLGKAIEVFTKPDRVVIGLRHEGTRARLTELFAPFTSNLEWMSVESAEMTKHALNAFLATSVAFINEIATICEETGADGLEVERGLKTDVRIGPKAYLHPGGAFAGGTLARDVAFLIALGEERSTPAKLLRGVMESNASHQHWARKRFLEVLGTVRGKTVTVLGLTYKPGTDTLRRSTAVEICRWLSQEGAHVQAYDPAVRHMPDDLEKVQLKKDAGSALSGSEAVLIATPWPQFLELEQEAFVGHMKRAVVLDPARFLERLFTAGSGVEFYGIGIAR